MAGWKFMTENPPDWQKIREIVTDIIGFHDLIERPDLALSAVQRIQYEARVYAGGVELARLMVAAMEQPEDNA
jgi:hypothetical protein